MHLPRGSYRHLLQALPQAATDPKPQKETSYRRGWICIPLQPRRIHLLCFVGLLWAFRFRIQVRRGSVTLMTVAAYFSRVKPRSTPLLTILMPLRTQVTLLPTLMWLQTTARLSRILMIPLAQIPFSPEMVPSMV